MATPSTQTQHPWRASLRTALVALTILAPAISAGGEEVTKFVDQVIPGTSAGAAISGTIAALTGLILLLNRIILLPSVAAALQAAGVGPVPNAPEPADAPVHLVELVDPASVSADNADSVRGFLSSKGFSDTEIQSAFDRD